MAKYANQITITINKDKMGQDFLQVENTDWTYAACDLTYSAFKIYLYLAKNVNGYNFDYSPTAIQNLGLMKKQTASDARKELEQKGYIINNVFYVRPPKRMEKWEQMKNELFTEDDY